MHKEIDIYSKLDPIQLFERYSYTISTAVYEFIDNSIANFEKNEHVLNRFFPQPKLSIQIIYDTSSHFVGDYSLIIADNAHGMTLAELQEGLIIQNVPTDRSNLNQYGVGMKSAMFWLGNTCEIETSQLAVPEKCIVYLDAMELQKTKGKLHRINQRFTEANVHYTVITISKLKRALNIKDLRDLVKGIQRTYALKLKQTSKIEIRVLKKEDNNYYSVHDKGEAQQVHTDWKKIIPVPYKERNIWTDSQTQKPYKWYLQDCILDEKKVYDFNGFVAIDKKVTDEGGIYLYVKERLIEVLPPSIGFASTFNPHRRIFAQLQCRGDWTESQAKDKINWQGNVKNQFLAKIKTFLKENLILEIADQLKDENEILNIDKLKISLEKKLQVLDKDEHGVQLEISLLDNNRVFDLCPLNKGWCLTVYLKHPFLLHWTKTPKKRINELIAIILLMFGSVITSFTFNGEIESIVHFLNNSFARFVPKSTKASKPMQLFPPSSHNNSVDNQNDSKLDINIPDCDLRGIHQQTKDNPKPDSKSSSPPNTSPLLELDSDLPSRNFFTEFTNPRRHEYEDRKHNAGIHAEIIANQINVVLNANDVDARVVNWTVGGQITHYRLECKDKVSKISKLEEEFKNKLGERKVYLRSVVSSPSAFGIDVPLPAKFITPVLWSSVANQLDNQTNPLSFLIGKNIEGKVEQLSLSQTLPHLLIAGATGQGKSVTLLGIITSLIFRNSPSNLRLLLIDVKRVELSTFIGLPHLWKPVITETEEVPVALQAVITEIDRRFQLLQEKQVDIITKYNQLVASSDKLPYIVVVIDEFADLILRKRKEIEDTIVRISQIGRAAGVHIILTTQRPSVDVISSLIKSNIQGRVALTVTSGYNSKIILDYVGAEKLLGKGDMLCLQPGQEPQRFQGIFITKEEIVALVNFWKDKVTNC